MTPSARAIPGPRGTALLRHLRAFYRDPGDALCQQVARYGPVSGFALPGARVVLLADPDLVSEVLLTNEKHFTKGPIVRGARRLFGQGLLTSEGEHHHRQRRALQPAFHREALESYVDVMAAEAERAVGAWKDGQERDAAHDMAQLTLAIVGLTLFGADVGGDAEEIASILRWGQRVGSIAGLYLSDAIEPVSRATAERLRRPQRRLESIVEAHVARHRGQPGRDDLLSLLLAAASPEDGLPTMTDAQVRDEALTVFVAGYETTSCLLAWTFYALGRHPEVEARLVAEVDAVLGDRLPSMEDLPRLGYLRRVLHEVLRLWPPAWYIGRQALEDCALGGGAVPIRKGTLVLSGTWVIHRDPRFFPDPLVFNPDRWTDGLQAALPRFAFFPFGAGSRSCIGEHFAMAEAAAIVAVAARRVRVRPRGGEPGRSYRMLLHPYPSLPVRIETRRVLTRVAS